MRQPYTYSMPESFLKDKSVPARWRVLAVINGFIINGGCFYGSNEWLMEQLNCSQHTISTAFSELEELGEIRTERTKRSRKVYKTSRDSNQLLSEIATEHAGDSNQLLPNSVSNSVKELGVADAPPVVVVSSSPEEEEGTVRSDKRTKDKEAIYKLFSLREQPWWRHKQQKIAAISLFDLLGVEKVKAGLEIMHENMDDKYCPQASTPFEYEEKLPALNRYVKRKGI